MFPHGKAALRSWWKNWRRGWSYKGHAVTCYNRSGHHVSGREYDSEHLDEYRGIRLRHLPTIDRKGLAAVTSSFFGCLAAAFGPYDEIGRASCRERVSSPV